MLNKYMKALNHLVKRRWRYIASFGALGVAIAGMIVLARQLPTGLVPQEDMGTCMVNVSAVPGANLGTTFEIMSRMDLDPRNDYVISDDGKLLYIRLAKVYDDYTKYRKDYAITGEVLAYREFRKQLQHSDLFVAGNQQKRMGDRNQKVWVLRFDALAQRCDVSGFMVDDVRPLT